MRMPSETFIAVWTLFLLAAPAAADAPHVQIEMLDAGVANLASQKILNSGHEKSLRTKLAHAAEALENGDRDATVRRLDTFTHQVRALEGKILPAKDAQFLAGTAATIRAGIDAVSTLPIGIDLSKIPLCQQTGCKTSGQRFVDAASVGSPFRTIAEAMESAAAEGLCRVEIVVAPGEYHETVTVDRNVMLRGSGDGVVILGSILNPAGFGLEVENLALRDSPAPGAIVTPFTCSATIIRGVVIERATRSGILQNGGAIEIFKTAVRDTRSEPDDSTSGVGIYLSGGIQAALRLVQIDRNSAGGLLIEGLATRVLASGVLVRENRMNPSFEAELIERFRTGGSAVRAIAGIEVREALLLLEWFAIEDNRYFGLLALDQARVAARYGIVRGSPSLPVSRFSSVGGSGIVAIDEAAGSGGDVPADERIIADLRFMTSSHNEFAGVVAVRAFITTRRARIEHNEIGVGLSFETTDHPELPSTKHALECVDARFVRRNPSGNFSFAFGGDLPLPCDPEFGIDCPSLPPCREVLFLCDWCS